MRKKLLIALALILLTVGGIEAANAQNKTAFAQKQTSTEMKDKQLMARYSPPKGKKHNTTVHEGRLKDLNIVGEAATVLNVLPITIIDEMNKGKTIAQIAQEKGLTQKEFTKKITDLETKTVREAVKSGIITKKHADAINQGRADRLKTDLQEKSIKVSDNMPMNMGN